MIFISESFRTIVFVFIGYFFITFRPVYPPAFLRCPCLSGHRNNSTREIIFKVWLLIKLGVQELWRSFASNDVIVFYAYPRSITRRYMRWSLSVIVFGLLSSPLFYFIFFYLNFLIIGSRIVFISILGLLSRSLQPNICADSLRRLILQCSALWIISTLVWLVWFLCLMAYQHV